MPKENLLDKSVEIISYLGDVDNTMSDECDQDNTENKRKRKKVTHLKRSKKLKEDFTSSSEDSDVKIIDIIIPKKNELRDSDTDKNSEFYQNQEGDPQVQEMMWKDQYESLNEK